MVEYEFSNELKEKMLKEKETNPFAVLSKLIYDGLYNEIITGKLLLDDKIIESQIAKNLNVSRTPVKMALNKLVEDGILEKGKGKELRVKKIRYEECLWLYEARLSIESKAAYLAAKRIKKNELSTLHHIIQDFKDIDKSYDYEKYIICDKLFHETVINASRNKYIIDMYKTLEFALQSYRYQTMQLVYEDLFEKNGLERGSDYHNSIYRALYNRMPLVAQDEMIADISRMYGTMHMIKFL